MWIQKEIQSRYFTEKLPAACRSVWNLKREAVNAVVELEKIGVVRRVFRTVRKGGMRNSNVLFLELNVDVLIQLTYPENLSDAGYHFLKGELSPHKERCHIRM